MRIPAFLLVYTSLSGCAGGQLAELELEQQQLRAEYEDVAANVAALRDEMVELGLITRAQANAKAPSQGRSGKKIKPRGNPSPANDLSEGMPWTATRTGDKPTLPALADLERSSGDCGWRFHVRELQPISDFPLNRDGFGKASQVPSAIEKAAKDGRKHLMRVPVTDAGSIPHEVTGYFRGAHVRLIPASDGTGLTAGQSVRAVCEMGGIRNILSKSFGSSNPMNLVKATLLALGQLRTAEEVAALRGVEL